VRDTLLTLCGALLVVLTGVDVFFTVLFPASGHGPIRKPLSRAVWRGFHLVAHRLSVERRRGLLAYSGPTMVAASIATWALLLLLGWALIYLPALGGGIASTSGSTDTSFATAMYVSGYSLTTLGTGDVAPQTAVFRLLRYFHYRDPAYSLPRILLLCLDSAALLEHGLHDSLVGSPPAAHLVDRASMQLLAELVPQAVGVDHGARRDWHARFGCAVARFREHGIAVASRPDAAAAAYAATRARWDEPVRALAAAEGYEWSEIEPSG
jgi:hypothetical protein